MRKQILATFLRLREFQPQYSYEVYSSMKLSREGLFSDVEGQDRVRHQKFLKVHCTRYRSATFSVELLFSLCLVYEQGLLTNVKIAKVFS